MILLARAGAIIALVGGGLGLMRWSNLGSTQRWLTVFLCVSGVLGALSAILRIMGYENPWIGNLWALSIPTILLPAFIHFMPPESRVNYWGVQRIAVIVWLVYFVAMANLLDFSMVYQAAQCMIGLVFSVGLLDEITRRGVHDAHWPGAWLALTGIFVFGCDALPNMADKEWMYRNESSQQAVWAIRNAAWCVGYGIMSYIVAKSIDRRINWSSSPEHERRRNRRYSNE